MDKWNSNIIIYVAVSLSYIFYIHYRYRSVVSYLFYIISVGVLCLYRSPCFIGYPGVEMSKFDSLLSIIHNAYCLLHVYSLGIHGFVINIGCILAGFGTKEFSLPAKVSNVKVILNGGQRVSFLRPDGYFSLYPLIYKLQLGIYLLLICMMTFFEILSPV